MGRSVQPQKARRYQNLLGSCRGYQAAADSLLLNPFRTGKPVQDMRKVVGDECQIQFKKTVPTAKRRA